MNRGHSFLYAVSVMLLLLPSYAGAFGWVLYGNVTDGGTCHPLQGVNISSTYSTMNISNAHGRYIINLGTGNWTITAKKLGYMNKVFITPYQTSGAFEYNFSMLMPGETAHNCLSGNVIGVTTPNTTIATTALTISPTTVPVTPTQPSSNNGSGLLYGAIVVAIIIVAAVAYLLSRKGGKKPEAGAHKTEHETAAEIRHEIAEERKAEQAAEGTHEHHEPKTEGEKKEG